MKKFKQILLLVFAVVAFSSCQDVLDTQPLDKFSEANVWTDASLTQGFIYDAMNDVYTDWLTVPNSSTLFSANDLHTDNQMRSGGGGNINLDDYDKFFDAGWDQFGQIRQANLIIEKVAASAELTEANKTNFIAQGHMLRAMIYARQARFFGKYTIIDKVLTVDDDLVFGRSATIKDTYDFILDDLTIAANGLPTNAEPGMLTKGAALALKAEMALHGAAYIESGKDAYYQIAKKASEDLFALGKYQLDSNYAGMFNTADGGLNSSEMILAYYSSSDNTKFSGTPMQRIVPNLPLNTLDANAIPKLTDGFSGWCRITPTWDLVTNYLVVDQDGIAKMWDETSYYQDYLNNGGYLSNAIFKNRDERFYASIVHDSSVYFGQTVTFRKGGNMHFSSNTVTWGMSPSGFLQRKGLYEAERLVAGANTAYHYSMFRLGRSYLNYAEVMLRLNQPSVALEYINKTRTKHGGLPELSTGLSIVDAWKYYKIERRVELYFENDRYWSLLRWGKEAGGGIIQELNTNKKTFEISSDGKSFSLLNVIPNGYDTRNKMNFSTRRYLFPVPEQERQLNGKLDQNPEW